MVLGGGLAYDAFGLYRVGDDRSALALGLVGVALIVLLIPYLFWFKVKMKKISLPLVLALCLWPQAGSPCAVCYGDPASLMAKGAKMGVLFLIVVVLSVLASITAVACSWNRRGRTAS